jgi:hypothetical protein
MAKELMLGSSSKPDAYLLKKKLALNDAVSLASMF